VQPRVFKQEHLPGVTRADLHEIMVAYGVLEFERRGAAPIMWILKSGPHVYWIETPWGDEIEKEASIRIIHNLVQKMGADCYSFMSEAWISVYQGTLEDLEKATPPSEMPASARDDVLMIGTLDKAGGSQTTQFLVTIRDNGRNYLGPRVDDDTKAASGRMWNLFA